MPAKLSAEMNILHQTVRGKAAKLREQVAAQEQALVAVNQPCTANAHARDKVDPAVK
jgi:hypothetical protein